MAIPEFSHGASSVGTLSATQRRRFAYAATLTLAASAWLAARSLSAQESPATPPAADAAAPADASPASSGVRDLDALEAIDDAEGGPGQARLREGTQLTDRLGRFRQSGESLSFIDESGRELGGLPNLSLERITNALKAVEEPESVWWSVSGTVTEFGDRNYLLVTRAVYKAAALPPTPESVE